MSNLYNLSNECTELDKGLAGFILSLKVGDKLPSTRTFAELMDASLGSISSSLNYLEEVGAVTIQRRGRLGSYLENKSLGILWNIVENGPLVIAQTLPSFKKCEGLATAIYSMLRNNGVEVYFNFIRGSINRMNALRSGQCHAAIMSELAADELIGSKEEVLLRLPPQTFVTGHNVFYRGIKGKSSEPMRVGVDNASFDVKYLTELEFDGREVEYHQMSFVQIDSHLQESAVDAAISDLDHQALQNSDEISSRPLSPEVQAKLGERNSSAAVVIRKDSNTTRIVLSEILDTDEIVRTQQLVVDGKLVPRY